VLQQTDPHLVTQATGDIIAFYNVVGGCACRASADGFFAVYIGWQQRLLRKLTSSCGVFTAMLAGQHDVLAHVLSCISAVPLSISSTLKPPPGSCRLNFRAATTCFELKHQDMHGQTSIFEIVPSTRHHPAHHAEGTIRTLQELD